MKKIKDTVMAIVTILALIITVLGAAAMDSESIIIPVAMVGGGISLMLLISRKYWHIS